MPPPSAALPSGPVGVPTPEKPEIAIGLSVTEPIQYAGVLAEQLGIYEANGLSVDIATFEGEGRALQALQSGQLDVAFIGPSSAITTRTTDVPVDIFATTANVLTDLFVSTASVTSAAELRGKCVAISTFGGTSHGAVLLSLGALELTADDVVITEVGSQDARIAALQGGSCAAAPADASRREQFEDLGFHVLVDLQEEGLPWARAGLAATEQWLAENPATALAVTASLLEAQNAMWTDTDEASRLYAEYIQSDEAPARAQIDAFTKIGERTLEWSDAAFEHPKEVLAIVNPSIEAISVQDAFDRRVLEELRGMGVYERLGIPE